MSFIARDLELNRKLRGKVVAEAASNLFMFALKFEDGEGLLVEISGTPESPVLATKVIPAGELPKIGDSISKVEWAWMSSSTLASVQSVTGSIELNMVPAGKLRILAEVSRGSMFLSFMPRCQ